MITEYSLNIVLTLEKLSIGGSTVLTFLNTASAHDDLLIFLNILKNYIDAIDMCEYTDLLNRISARAKNTLLIDRDIIDGKVVPVISGSTVKGVFRSAFEKMILEKIIDHRRNLLANASLVKEINNIITRDPAYRVLIAGLIRDILQHYTMDDENNPYKNIADNVLASYILAISPYTCLSTLTEFSCSFPQNTLRMKFFNELNKKLINNEDDVYGCIEDNGVRHCLPINYSCVTCSLFGVQGYLSIPRFRTFRINCSESKIVTFNRIFTKKQVVIPFNIEILDGPVKARGIIELVIDPRRVRDLLELSYLKYIRSDDKVLDKDIAKAVEVLVISAHDRRYEDIVKNTIQLYKILFVKILRYLKDSGARLGIGFGRRRKIGFGRIIDYKIDEEA